MSTIPLDPATLNHADLLYHFWYGRTKSVLTLADIARREGVAEPAIYTRLHRGTLPYPVFRVRNQEWGTLAEDYIPGTKKNGPALGRRRRKT